MNRPSYFMICKNLIHADLIIFKQFFLDKFIDISIWILLTILVMGYIMPFFGLQRDFGVFQFAGTLAAVGLFELYGSAVDLVSDFEGDRVINYNLTLPMPSWMALASKAAYYAIIYCLLTVMMLPIGKLCLWNQLDLASINYPQLIAATMLQSIFYGCFVIFVSSLITNMAKLGSVWARFIFPMWFMGGFNFSWFALYKMLPAIALINLVNPMIYVTESVRVAFLGQQGYINFWICLVVIVLCAVISLAVGMRILKKRLDFV